MNLFANPTSLDAQIRAVKREIMRRKRVYPQLIEAGVLRGQDAANHELAVMEAVLDTLTHLKEDQGHVGDDPRLLPAVGCSEAA